MQIAFTELAASPEHALLGALGTGALILAGIAVADLASAAVRRVARAVSRPSARAQRVSRA